MKTKKIISVILCITLLLTTIFCLSGVKEYDEKLLTAEKIAKKLFVADDGDENELVYSYNLKGLDEEEDYILVKGRTKGYAIFTKEDLQLIEYSPESKSPYEDYDMSKSYYAGPINHMVKRGTSFMNIYSNERISANNAVTLATNVKSDIKDMKPQKDVQIKDLQSSSITKTVSNEQANEKSGIDDENIEFYDPDKYADEWALVSRNYIYDYSYFLADPYYVENTEGTCTVIATQLLMSYNNWSKYGLLITEPSFIMNSSGSGVDRDEPYLYENISTTREFNKYLEELLIDVPGQGANVLDAKNAIDEYMSTYKPNINYNVDYTFNASTAKTRMLSEISNNRPSMGSIWYTKEENGVLVEEAKHMVVVYGYQLFYTPEGYQDGFIVHMGWGEAYNRVWVDSDWFVGCLTFNVTHTHNTVSLDNDSHILKCTTCGVRKTTGAHTYIEHEEKTVYDYLGEGDYEMNDKNYHWSICTCGQKKEMPHDFIYGWYSSTKHTIGCSLCGGDFGKEEHNSKYSDYCIFCGGQHNINE